MSVWGWLPLRRRLRKIASGQEVAAHLTQLLAEGDVLGGELCGGRGRLGSSLARPGLAADGPRRRS